MFRKVAGLFLIFLGCALFLMFLLIISMLINGEMGDLEGNSVVLVLNQAGALILFIVVISFLIKQGMKWYRKQTPVVTKHIELNQVLNVRLSEREYVRLLFFRAMRKQPFFLIIFISGMVMLLAGVTYYSDNPLSLEKVHAMHLPLGAIFASLPFIIYYNLKSQFRSNDKIHGAVHYQMNIYGIWIKGADFESSFGWQTLHKVEELKSAFLLYQNKFVAMILPKRSFENQQAINDFKDFLLSVNSVEKEFK